MPYDYENFILDTETSKAAYGRPSYNYNNELEVFFKWVFSLSHLELNLKWAFLDYGKLIPGFLISGYGFKSVL